jgi:hypothetical protein
MTLVALHGGDGLHPGSEAHLVDASSSRSEDPVRTREDLTVAASLSRLISVTVPGNRFRTLAEVILGRSRALGEQAGHPRRPRPCAGHPPYGSW